MWGHCTGQNRHRSKPTPTLTPISALCTCETTIPEGVSDCPHGPQLAHHPGLGSGPRRGHPLGRGLADPLQGDQGCPQNDHFCNGWGSEGWEMGQEGRLQGAAFLGFPAVAAALPLPWAPLKPPHPQVRFCHLGRALVTQQSGPSSCDVVSSEPMMSPGTPTSTPCH